MNCNVTLADYLSPEAQSYSFLDTDSSKDHKDFHSATCFLLLGMKT